MATLLLAAAVPGSFWGAAVGWQMAAYAGAAVADSFIMRQLFPPPKPKSRLGDIHLQTAESGAPMAMLFGSEVRVGCEVIWKSTPREVEIDQGGGCGGPSIPSSYGYFADVGIAFGQPPPGAVVEGLDRLWFDGRIAYDASPDVDYTSGVGLDCIVEGVTRRSAAIDYISNQVGNPVVVTVRNPSGAFFTGDFYRVVGVQGATNANGDWPNASGDGPYSYVLTGCVANGAVYTQNTGTFSTMRNQQKIQSPNGGPDLSLFQAGYDVSVSGYDVAANNGTFNCVSSGINSATGVSWVILDNPNVVAESGSGDTIVLHQSLPSNNPRHLSDFEFYGGSQWQQPDPTMEAVVGANKTPAHVGISWGLISDLNLTLFGDRIPNCNALLRVTSGWTVGQSISGLCERAGLSSDEIDVSTLTMPLRGYNTLGPISTQGCLAAIMTTFDVVCYEEDGRLVFVKHKDIPSTVIDSTDLAAHEQGGDAPRPFKVRPAPERSIPTEVQVHYFNPAKDWQGDMEPARRSGAGLDNTSTFESGIVMSPGPAQDLARRILRTADVNRDLVETRLPPSRSLLHEGSKIRVTGLGKTWNVLANKIDFQRSGVVALEGPNDEAAALDFTASPADGGADNSGGPGVLAALDLVVIDVAPLSDSQLTEPGIYVATAPTGLNRTWIGAALYESSVPDDGTFTLSTDLDRSSSMGYAATALGGGVSAYMIDRANTLDVTMTFGSAPGTLAEDKMLKGANRLWYGGEIIGFTTVTLIDAGAHVYRLTNLLRGLRDTEHKIDTHQANEKVVFLSTGGGAKFVAQSISMLDTERYFRAVVNGGIVDDYPAVGAFYEANTVRPFSVFDVRATRDPNDSTPDVALTWKRQSRANVHGMYPNPIPLVESTERYEVQLLVPTGASVATTHFVTSPADTFTTAEVVAAGYSALASITVRIYQVGDFVGRGRERRVTV